MDDPFILSEVFLISTFLMASSLQTHYRGIPSVIISTIAELALMAFPEELKPRYVNCLAITKGNFACNKYGTIETCALHCTRAVGGWRYGKKV